MSIFIRKKYSNIKKHDKYKMIIITKGEERKLGRKVKRTKKKYEER